MSSARSLSPRARLRRAALFQIEGLERRFLLSTAIAAFGAQQTFAVGSQPRGLAVADVNLDGKPDLLIANAGSTSNSVSVLLGTGIGTFQPQLTFASGTAPFAITVADVNLDGKPDLLVANNGSNSVGVLLGNGNGTFQTQVTFATGSAPRSIAVADVNGDGKPDIVAGNYSANSVSVLLGTGTGSFAAQQTYATGTQPRSLTIADVNLDGKPDLITANHGSGSVSVLLNSGAGTFPTQTTFATGTGPFSVTTSDVNLDGKPDILVANNGGNTVGVLLNTGTGSFSAQQTFATSTGPIAIASADVNGDGKPDILVANFNANNAGILLGNGDGNFQPQKTFATGTGPRSIATADVNRDGRQDLIAGNYSSNSVSELLGDVPPTVLSINRANPPYPSASPGSVSYTVTFNEPVSGVDATDFSLALTGSVTATTPVVASGNGAVYTVTINGVSGSGTLGLNLADDGSIQDAAGNPLQPGGVPGFQPQQTFPTAGQASIVGDVNGDGRLDVLDLVGSQTNPAIGVLLGNGNGTFTAEKTFAAGSPPTALALADVNADGKVDLVTTAGGAISVWLGNGNGTFQPRRTFSAGPYGAGIVVADLNGDGKVDVATGGIGTAFGSVGAVSVLLGNGDGTFQARQTFAAGLIPGSIAVADVNGDGKPDLIVANHTQHGAIGVLLGNGNGTFQAQQTFAAGGDANAVVASDLNGDGRPDLVVANGYDNNVGVFLGNGNGTFGPQQTFAAGLRPWQDAVLDVNDDGRPDIVAVDFTSTGAVNVLLGNGNGTFQTRKSFVAGATTQSFAVTDINADARPDLVVASGNNSMSVLLGNSNGSFTGQLYTIIPPVDTLTGTSGTDAFTLTKDVDGTDIDWSTGASTGRLPINDPNGLTINGNGGNDMVTLLYTNGNPLPAILHLSGNFTIYNLQGTNPLSGTSLEIGKSTVYISYSGSDPIATIQSYLQNGYNGGAWNGVPTATNGAITSSAAALNNGYMIGYADSADGIVAGQPANTVEVKYTLGGDLNLSATVVFNDFALVVANYGKPAVWDGGAITYGATVSFADFALTVANYGKQAVTSAMLAAPAVNSAQVSASGTLAGDSSREIMPAADPVGSTDPVNPRQRKNGAVRKRC
jgi:hypothetical protein